MACWSGGRPLDVRPETVCDAAQGRERFRRTRVGGARSAASLSVGDGPRPRRRRRRRRRHSGANSVPGPFPPQGGWGASQGKRVPG